MNYTTNFNLKMPELHDPVDVGALNENAEMIDKELGARAKKPGTAAAGNLAALDAEGNLQDSGKGPDDFAAAKHASNHGPDGGDPLRPETIGAASNTLSAATAALYPAGTETVDAGLAAVPGLIQNSRARLLWQNASPGSAFAAQTLSLDLSGYSAAILIVRYFANYGAVEKTFIFPTNSMEFVMTDFTGNGTTRTVTIMDSGIQFGSGSNGNGWYVPTYIYGL